MTIEKMRSKVAEVYRTDNWKRKVYLMPDDQVTAIYYTMKRRGFKKVAPRKPKEPGIRKAVQISMFDPNFSAT